MSRYKRDYDDIHGFVERVEDVLLSESSWSTSDSDCSGCLHLSKESLRSEDALGASNGPDESLDSCSESSPQRAPLVAASSGKCVGCHKDRKGQRLLRHSKHKPNNHNNHSTAGKVGLGNSLLNLGRSTGNYFNSLPSCKSRVPQVATSSNHYRSHPSITDHLVASGVKCSGDNSVPVHQRGRMLQQRALLAAGAQPWNVNICASSGRQFAYAATLVIYVYEVQEGTSDWQLCSILADHRKVITSLNWHPHNTDLIASSSEDQRVCIWSVSRQQVVVAISLCRAPILTSWCSLGAQRDVVSFSTSSGPIQLWDCSEGSEPMPYRENYPYSRGLRLYKWHPVIAGRLVVAHNDAKITIYREDSGHVKSNWCPEADTCGGELASGEVMGMEWAVCSPDYLLVSYSSGKLWLLDVTAFVVVTAFVLPASVTVATMAWLPEAPGMFVTGDTSKGVLRVWTVGKSTALHSHILKDTGFHELSATRIQSNLSSDMDNSSAATVPPVPVLCLFRDGGVGLYHLRRKHWVFNREHGHTETIFDCSFKPDDSDLLATGSFDGSIKIWRVDTLESVETLPNCRSIIYSVSWAPADLNCIVASTNDGRVFIWDITKHKVLQEFPGHKKAKVYCVTWNQKDSRRIASVGESCLCLVHEVSGIQLQAYQHPEPVYGCDWRNSDTLATGCHDGRIRIYNVTSPRQEPSVVLKAHSKKVFRVQWNPVFSDILCSGSDDTTVRLWAVSKAQCLAVLVGHSEYVRGLAWCPEVPYLLVSGSWDRSIRVWDARSAKCLDVVLDHGADIYGLSIHPVRPFLLASCSRDSTVRLWSLSSFVNSLYLKALSNTPLHHIVASPDGASLKNLSRIPSELCGLRASHLLNVLKKTEARTLNPSATAQSSQHGRLLRLTADMFSADVHIRNLWDLVSVVGGQGDMSTLSPQYPASIVHHSHLAKCDMAAAETDYQKSLAKRVMTLRRTTHQENALSDVVQRYLKCGALRQYCDVMIKRGQWDHALAIAPAVSMDYWKQLIGRYSQQLLAEDSDQCVAYLSAAKDLDKLVEFHIARGNIKSAFSACVALNNRSCRARPKQTLIPEIPPRPSTLGEQGALSPPDEERQAECAALLADWHLKRGSPVLACCAMLAADRYQDAMLYLLRGHELELVLVVGRLLTSCRVGGPDVGAAGYVDCAVRYLCYRALRLSQGLVALNLAKTHSKGLDAQVLLCEVLLHQSPPLSSEESTKIVAEAGSAAEDCSVSAGEDEFPPPPEDELQQEGRPEDGEAAARPSEGNEGPVGETPSGPPRDPQGGFVLSIIRLLLSSQPQQGVTSGLAFAVDQLRSGHLDDPDLWRVVRLLQSFPLPVGAEGDGASVNSGGSNGSVTGPPTQGTEPLKAQQLPRETVGAILSVSAATGAVKAAVLGYGPVVQHLISAAKMYLEQYKPQHFDTLMSFVRSLQARWDESAASRSNGGESPGLHGVNVGAAVRQLWCDEGPTRVTGSHLPRHSDAHTCCLTRGVVRGPSFILENGESVLGINEALMWAKVHPFSPLGTPAKLNPF